MSENVTAAPETADPTALSLALGGASRAKTPISTIGMSCMSS